MRLLKIGAAETGEATNYWVMLGAAIVVLCMSIMFTVATMGGNGPSSFEAAAPSD